MEDRRHLISVIVPVYNVKPYLPKCLASICNQTYTNLEIIVVDDGSTDGSGAVCDEWALKDKRVKVLHFQNCGVSFARNRGIDVANGAYLGFIDSDDWIEPDMYERLYKVLVENDVDMALCSCWFERDGDMRPFRNSGVVHVWSGKDNVAALLNRKYMNFAWDKLYKKSLFDGLRFPEGRGFEDMALMYRLYALARKTAQLEVPLYHYVWRKGSLSHPKSEVYVSYQAFLAMIERSRFLCEYDVGLYRQSINKTVRSGIRLIDRVIDEEEKSADSAKYLKFAVAELPAVCNRHTRPDLWIKCWLAIKCFSVYVALRKCFNNKSE